MCIKELAYLLKTCSVDAIKQSLSHALILEKPDIPRIIPAAELIRGNKLMELPPDTFISWCTRSESAEDIQSPFGRLGVLLQHVPWAFRVPERDYDKCQTDGDLDDIGNAPGNIVRRLVKGHSIAGPEGDQGTQLVAELGYCSNEAATELGGCTLGDIEVGGDVYAPEA